MHIPLRHPHLLLAAASALVVAAVTFALVAEADGAIRRVGSAEGAAALTFDDGPHPRHTPAVLDALAEAGASATFFVVGEQAARYPELVERIVAEGHEVAHHTHTHPRLDAITRARFAGELERGLRAVDEAGASRPVWYRPPRGHRDAALEAMAEQRGLRVALWRHCFEWGSYHSAHEMALRMAAETHEGDIVLAHDGLGDRTMTVEALPLYLESVQARGIKLVTLSELERSARD